MKTIYLSLLILVGLLNNLEMKSQHSFELVKFDTEDDGIIEAAFFPSSTKKVVIFAHGAIFNKESWYFLSKKFQKENIASLSIDFRGYGNSKSGSSNKKSYDILGAIKYLNNKGFKEINIVGGSMGGAAVLGALTLTKVSINKVVLMAPAGGLPIKSEKTDKLFIVSKEEGMYTSVKSIYDKSSKPKKIKIYRGSSHAQHLFKSDYADEVESLIIKFVSED
ncbi:MAG: alpha/beta hydrolase [Flavobacteriaceae bacterium]|nr:alpha/beta hydrolase [Flavobacteriaceae bacterium]